MRFITTLVFHSLLVKCVFSFLLNPTFQSTRKATQLEATVSNTPKTPLPKYPTARGDDSDSRRIIATGAGRLHLTAVRLHHILLATEEMASASLHELRSGAVSFADLAEQVSACTATRSKKGELGWVSVTEEPTQQQQLIMRESSSFSATDTDNSSVQDDGEQPPLSPNAHLDEFFPREAREKLLLITTKPGDVVMVPSHLGYHLVQVVDVMANVRKMASQRKRRTSGSSLLEALRRDTDLTYKLETMGCQMNTADSERMEGQLQDLGLRPSQEGQNPDVVVLNTCSIRDHAEQKVYSYLGPYAKRKRNGEDVTIVVAGCVAQQEGEALLRKAPEIDLVMGPQYANRIGDLLEDVANGNQVVATEATHIMEDSTKPRRQSSVAAWVNVIYGCNERCAFCIVPTTRGVEQSRPVESIITEVEELVAQGFKEVTLLGQNIDAYGRDMIPKRKFSDLIRIVGGIPGLERLRFVTSHPRYMSLGVVDAVAETPQACESFHIPFQSGSNRILAAMGRGHTREKYLYIVDRIRSKIPDASITADVIVGFPGETEEDFQDSLALMEEVRFDNVHTAAYSPRPNTPAATMEDQIPDHVKKDRLSRINDVNKRIAVERRAALVGSTMEILVEERNIRNPVQVLGRTRQGFTCYMTGDIDELRGKTVKAEITSAKNFHLVGQIVD